MDAPTLGSIFSKHLAFPAGGKARVSVDAFAERLLEKRLSTLHELKDPSAWVEHFFQIEHDGEALAKEFRIVATLGEGEKAPVLEIELAEQEFAIVETEDEIVVMSEGGSMVVGRTSDLSAKLQSAQLPSSERASMNAAFRGPGERAYYVSRSGQILTLDAKTVARVLASAPAPRVEPLVHISKAPERLAPFIASSRVEAKVAPAGSRPTEPVRRLADVAKAELRGGGPQVIVVEKSGQIREQRGASARWWSRLATALSEPAGRRDASSMFAGASAVSLGRQTWAVKAGGVTALVQRPAEAVTRRNNAEARRGEVAKDARETPSWLRRVLDERPRAGSSYWIDPSARSARSGASAARPAWISAALSQASDIRQRARAEISEQVRPVAVAPAPGKTSSRPQRIELDSVSVAGLERALATRSLEISAAGEGRLPASLLRNVFLGLERSLSLESGIAAPSAVRASIALADRATPVEVEFVSRQAPAAPQSVLNAPFDRSSVRVGREIVPSFASAPVTFAADIEASRPAPAIPLEDPYANVEVSPLSVVYPRGVRTQLRPEASPASGPRATLDGRAHAMGGFSGGATLAMSGVGAVAGSGFDAAAPVGATVARGVVQLSARGSSPSTYSMPDLDGVIAAPARDTADGPAAMTASAWLDWAMRHSGEARAKTAGETIARADAPEIKLSRILGQPSTNAASAGAGERSHFPSESTARERLGRMPSMFIRFDAGGGDAGPRGLKPMAVDGPEIGLFAAPMSPDGSFAPANPWRFPAGDSTLPRPGVAQKTGPAAPWIEGRWSPAGGTRESIPVRLSPLFLQDVNARRAPDPVATAARYSAESEPLSEEYVVPVPLWVQMSGDSPHVAAFDATRERASGARTTVSGLGVPQLQTSTVSSGGSVTAPHSSTAYPGAPDSITLARPGNDPFTIRSAEATPAPASAVPTRAASAAASFGSLFAGGTASASADASHGLAGSAPSSPELATPSTGAPEGGPSGEARGYFPSERRASERAAGGGTPGAKGSASAAGASRDGSSQSASTAQTRGSNAASADARARSSATPATTGTSAAVTPRPSPSHSYFPSEQRRLSRQGWGGTLRFRFPSAARWWPSAAAPGAAATRDAATAGAVHTEYVKVGAEPVESSSSLGLVGLGTAGAGAAMLGGAAARSGGASPGSANTPGAQRSSGGSMSSPTTLARGRKSGEAQSYFPSDLTRAEASTGTEASATGVAFGAPSDGEPAYVAVSPTGEAAVLSGRAAAASAAKRSAGGGSVDMTVVAAMTPQAPSLEDMATAGHERPHLKAKKEGGVAKGGAGKSDNMSLQGTVDSLAQRIYHRLKRRLASDRERFGG